jgi:PAS domain-containing protein
VRLALSEQLARGEIPRYQLEKRYIRKDGSVVDIMLSGSILRGPDNAPVCYVAQMEDISERKRAEAALRRSEAKFSGIVSIAADAIISVDANQRITVFNAGAEQIFGYSEQEMIGTLFERLLPERYRMKHRPSFAAFASGDAVGRTMAEGAGRSTVFARVGKSSRRRRRFPRSGSAVRRSSPSCFATSPIARAPNTRSSVQWRRETSCSASWRTTCETRLA